MKPQFSIVIPFYNAAATLVQTLNSVAAQTYGEYELILVNDGSKDNSLAICKQWMNSHSNIDSTLLEQENGGLGNARNRGIREASHAWLALLDADDLWASDKLEMVAETIQRQAADIYYHPMKSFGLNRSQTRSCPRVANVSELLIKGNPILPSAAVGKTYLFRKYSFSENPSYHGAEDLKLWIDMMGDKVIFERIDQILGRYREVGGMSTDLEDHLQRVFRVLDDLHQQGILEEGLWTLARRRKHYEAGRFYHKRGLFKKAGAEYGKSKQNGLKTSVLKLLAGLGLAA